jgi:hypothetical protein
MLKLSRRFRKRFNERKNACPSMIETHFRPLPCSSTFLFRLRPAEAQSTKSEMRKVDLVFALFVTRQRVMFVACRVGIPTVKSSYYCPASEHRQWPDLLSLQKFPGLLYSDLGREFPVTGWPEGRRCSTCGDSHIIVFAI